MKHTLLISAIVLACAITASPALCFAILAPDAKTEQLQIIGDYADSNKANNTFAAHGNVKVSITGQDANLEADDVLVDLNSATIDARGHVRITRHNELTTGSAFKFRISSNEYLITTSTTQVTGPSLSSRICSGKPFVVWDVIVEGNRLIPSDDILHVIKSKHGDRFVRDRVMEDLKAIVALGYFDKQNIRCTPELDTYGVILKFHVQENSPVYEFVVEGNEAISTHEILLSNFFLDQLGKPVNQAVLSRSLTELEKVYQTRGYPQARVSDVVQLANGAVKLVIVEGQMNKTLAASVSHEPARISLSSHVTFAPSVSNYYGEDRYLPTSSPNKHFGFRQFSYSEQDWVRLPFGRSRKPSSFLFTDWKFGTWKPIANKSSTVVRSKVYGLKTPPQDLLPAMLFPNEHLTRKPLPLHLQCGIPPSTGFSTRE